MSNKTSRFGTAMIIGAVLAVVAIGIMMFGARLGLWEPIVGFGLVRTYMNPIGYAVAGLAVLGLIFQLVMRNKAGAVKASIAIVIGVGILAPMIYGKFQTPVRYPPIHDISTDTTNPPVFMVLDETRSGAKNTLDYGGAEVAAQQATAYPDIAPIESKLSASEAYTEALRIGEKMGWEIVAQDQSNLRFEATARTPVYQFADDIVVVVTPLESASRVDMRSVSRVGRSDRGVNAARIRAFTEAFGG